MSVPTDRLPVWTVAMPFVALVAAVLAAVHHAEVVALHVGEPGGAVPLALSFMMALIS